MDAVIPLPRAATATPTIDFSRLYDETVDTAWGVLARLGVRSAELEDAVQDVFVIVHRRLGDLHVQSKASTWVTGIAVRVAHDYRRRLDRKPTEPLAPHAPTLADQRSSPDEALSRSQAAEVLLRLLDQLEPTQREVFVLAELEQHSAPDIALLTGAPVNTVYSRLRLARARFDGLVQDLHRGGR